jgi:hypothetical protein
MTRDQLTRQMQRLMLADYAFRQSRDALRFICDNQPSLPSPLVEITLSGACATYCRPFTKSSFYGRLEAEFTRFPGDTDFQSLHDELWRGRNWVVAHSEPQKAAELFGGQPADLTEIGILFKRPKGMTAFVNEPILAFHRIDAFSKMCEFQSLRVLEKFRSLLPTAFKKQPMYNHRYRLGVDFPE